MPTPAARRFASFGVTPEVDSPTCPSRDFVDYSIARSHGRTLITTAGSISFWKATQLALLSPNSGGTQATDSRAFPSRVSPALPLVHWLGATITMTVARTS